MRKSKSYWIKDAAFNFATDMYKKGAPKSLQDIAIDYIYFFIQTRFDDMTDDDIQSLIDYITVLKTEPQKWLSQRLNQ